ncbi:pilus assembly protein PilM [Nocardioides pakistanensis]
MTDRVVGLDIGASSVKAAQVLRKGDGTFTVEKQAASALPFGVVQDGHVEEKERARVAAIIRQMWTEAKFDTKDVIVGYNSSSAVFMTEMRVPLMKPEDVHKALPTIVEARNPSLSPDENEMSFTVVGEVDGDDGPELRVLAYSVRSDFAEAAGRLVDDAGLNLVGADLSALATLRAMQIQDRPDTQLDALVDIGANITTLVLHHNGVPKMLLLDPDSSGNVATTRIADAMGLDEGDEHQAEWQKINDESPVGIVAQARNEYSANLAAKVANGFGAYLNRHQDQFEGLANVTLVGGGALLHGLGYFLRQSLGSVPLSYAQVDDNITGPKGGEVERLESASGGDFLVAVGLGTGARL